MMCYNDSFFEKYNRETISYMVVILDMAILLFFTLGIFRLKYYERLSILDMKHGQMRIEDFTVQMNNIPMSKSAYNNNPDLLNAILYSHFEDALVGEL